MHFEEKPKERRKWDGTNVLQIEPDELDLVEHMTLTLLRGEHPSASIERIAEAKMLMLGLNRAQQLGILAEGIQNLVERGLAAWTGRDAEGNPTFDVYEDRFVIVRRMRTLSEARALQQLGSGMLSVH